MKGHRHRQSAEDVRFLDCYPAEILEPRQTDMLDDEVQVREGSGCVVDIGDVEGILVQGPDRGALVNVDVRHAKVQALLKVLERPLVCQFPPLGIILPLRGIELDAFRLPLVDLLFELFEALVFVARIKGRIENELVGMLFLEHSIAFGGVEAFNVEIAQGRSAGRWLYPRIRSRRGRA